MEKSSAFLACFTAALMMLVFTPAETRSGEQNRDSYGGWKGIQFKSTGFFRVDQRNGIWWLVTPEGNAFISKGVNHVSFRADHAPKLGYSPYERAVRAKYGSQEAWAKAAVSRLREWGFNTLGAWSNSSTFTHNMAYTVNLNLATRAGANWLEGAVGDFFSPDFEEKMEAACSERCGSRKNDPWLLGYFTDNELRWGADWRGKRSLLEEYLRFPDGAAGKEAALEFLKKKYRDIGSLNNAWGTSCESWKDLDNLSRIKSKKALGDQEEWQEIVARRYFSVCSNAIRKADPNHLILGCRFAGHAPEPVLRGLREHVDVVSFNNYGQDAPVQALERIHRLTGRPAMLTEFSFKAMDSGLPNTRGAGRAVATQSDRAEGFTRYVRGLLDLSFLVGFHWFEHADEPKEGRFDGENSNYGLVTIEDKPWEVLTTRMKEVNSGLETRHEKAKGNE